MANESSFPYYSSWNQLKVKLLTNGQYANTGFFAEYRSMRYDIDEDLKGQLVYNGSVFYL